MTRNRRRWLTALGVGVAMIVAVGTYVSRTAPVALADTSGWFVSRDSAAEPSMIQCTDPKTGQPGFCLYAVRDTGAPSHPPENFLPVKEILGFFSVDGQSWASRGTDGVVFTEKQVPGVPDQANHLWAPTVSRGPDGKYYLYVAEIFDKSGTGVHTSSRIEVASSDSPFGPFSYEKRVHFAEGATNAYQSDPEVYAEPGNRYLMWTNGDAHTCGGISMAELSDDMTTIEGRSMRSVDIAGVEVLGSCTPDPRFGSARVPRPFIQAPALFKFRDSARELTFDDGTKTLPATYTLVFAAKPDHVPVECTTDKGQPGSQNEVIGYATAPTAVGPFTYQGILMCGSSTVWSNHATIAMMRTSAGKPRLVLIYQDGPASYYRKLHAECLWFGAGTFALATRTSTGFTDCMNGVNAAAFGLRSQVNGAVVSATNAGRGPLTANRWAVGPWERFDMTERHTGRPALPIRREIVVVGVRAHANGRFVAVRPNAGLGSQLIADGTDINEPNAAFLVLGERGNGALTTCWCVYLQSDGQLLPVGQSGPVLRLVPSDQWRPPKFDLLVLGLDS